MDEERCVSVGGKLEKDTGVIRFNKVIAVEGQDEVYFFDALLRNIKITDVEVREVGGKDQFRNKLPALVRMRGFPNVEVLAVIRDANGHANKAFGNIKGLLGKQGLKPPNQMGKFSDSKPKVGIFIMPNNSDPGMLEDLCLKTVENHVAMRCIKIFSDCTSELENPPKNEAKAKVQVFLAAMPKIANCVGIGAQKGYWDLNSDDLSDLKSFIGNLR